MIDVRLSELLAKKGWSFYRLRKETGVSSHTLWRLKRGDAQGITFEVLGKICEALGCQVGDVLSYRGRLRKVANGHE